ncbi:S1C family serine protease [Aeoliella sp.]|uniref:S1C family serine protease n=1 Tax=Aeoliella sp. TaxID=2795800 RepID=UPI003CCBF458
MNRYLLLAILGAACFSLPAFGQRAEGLGSFAEVNRYAQERSVKIYGVGGLRQLEAYQSGVLVSAEGHIATVASLVLDDDTVTVLLSTGQRLEASVVGVDPLLDVAVLKLDTDEADFPYFDLTAEQMPYEGMRVLAFSNLYNVATGDEPVSVLHGVLSVIAPLEARRGAFSSRFRGDVYIVDAATNNPGAPGGVLLDTTGQPLGMLGKELKSELTGSWLNYALPWERVGQSVNRILRGDLGSAIAEADQLPENPATFASLGFRLVPSVVARTPPYIDAVLPGSPAASADLMPDDLIIALAGMRTGTHIDVEKALMQLPGDQPIRLTVLRGNMLVEVELVPMAMP